MTYEDVEKKLGKADQVQRVTGGLIYSWEKPNGFILLHFGDHGGNKLGSGSLQTSDGMEFDLQDGETMISRIFRLFQ